MIRITPSITIDEREITETFLRSSGPGGQHVNKVSTAVQLRFDVTHSPSLPQEVRNRLMEMNPGRMSAKGVLIITARNYRSREQNRKDALDRLIRLIRQAAKRPRIRKPTRPTTASRKRRLEAKRRRSMLKRQRRALGNGEW